MPEEEHGGDGADPIPVRGQDAVLIGGGRPAHQFERAEVGGEEAEARDPGRHLAAGQEEIFAGVGEALQIEADAQHGDEIHDDDREVDRGQGHQPRLQQQRRKNSCNRLHLHIVWDLNFRVKDAYVRVSAPAPGRWSRAARIPGRLPFHDRLPSSYRISRAANRRSDARLYRAECAPW